MDGWIGGSQTSRHHRGQGEERSGRTPDLTIKRKKYKTDLIPPPLIVAQILRVREGLLLRRYGSDKETAAYELEEFAEEHAGEDSLCWRMPTTTVARSPGQA